MFVCFSHRQIREHLFCGDFGNALLQQLDQDDQAATSAS